MIRVCSLAELPAGEVLRLEMSPAISIFHTQDGELFAVDDTCTHQKASLADGWVEGCEVECPIHSAIFNLRTGEPDGSMTTEPLRTHQVSVSDGDIYLTVSSEPTAEQPGTALPTGP
ncbi:MAG TPA: bifunctional 3-phenylpropionate/cinnamic acid dioxygenase ferredoxin subunit [Jatrophihabitans sp.]|jgi:3-phenylpropionate/trans-cinnamate dioxygenase ferredoxin subunit|uniref:bifunctional 3-phenylpropionate/cinnamic acid dioxygenase ferredoxin subunit n=1 Tax=Jatrophihabitans sp. TaxID=1932789 RepID=UPI002F246BBC